MIERIDSGDDYMDKSDQQDIPELHWQMAERKYTEDCGMIADWICVASKDREFSEAWGMISTDELVRLCFGGELNDEQAKSTLDELRKRYLAENRERIEFDAGRME